MHAAEKNEQLHERGSTRAVDDDQKLLSLLYPEILQKHG